MVTLIKYGTLSGGEKYNVNVLNLDGLSTNTKPTVTYIEYGSDGREVGRTGIPNGSIFTEIDTGDTYMYDADNMAWYQVTIGGGGGGDKFVAGANITITDNGDGTKTIAASGEISSEDTVARESIANHKADKSNPHEVTKAQVGLGDVDNTADLDKPVSTATQTALDEKQDAISDLTTIRSGAALGATAVQPEAGKGLSSNDYTTAEKTKLDNLAEIKTIGTGLNLDENGELTATGGGTGGTTNYNDLSNKPQINGNTLSGNKTGAQLGLASASDIPTTLAELTDDATHRVVTDTEKATWNAKADVTDIPDVPVKGIKKNNTAITPDASGVVNITVPTTAADVSALPDTTKYGASISLSINTSTFVVTATLKDQNGDTLGTAQTIDLPLESVVVNGSYNSTTKKVVLTLQNGQTVEFSIANLVNGLVADDYDHITLGNGKSLYISDTTPTGARTGDLWIGG